MTFGSFYARDGEEITLEQWGRLLADRKYATVAQTEFAGVMISTVWLGMEHHLSFSQPAPDYPVAIFETMIFGGDLDQYQTRYGTEAAALDGHAAAVELARVAHQVSLPDADGQRVAELKAEWDAGAF